MSPELVLDIGRQAMQVLLMLSAPLLGVAMAVGLLVSVTQAITQINETTLTFLPKLIGIAAAIVLVGPWLISLMTEFIREMLQTIPLIASGRP
ncbi:MAG: flagellar biosynthesis protein FliQ [Burkholderiaceae bacterium]